MNKPDLEALLEDLQNAKEGSRELSNRCLLAVGWTMKKLCSGTAEYWFRWIDPEDTHYKTNPDPSRNTQDALDCMVPEGWHLENMRTGNLNRAKCRACAHVDLVPNQNNNAGWALDYQLADAPTLCLAIVIARVRLRIQQLIGKCDDT